MSIAMVLRTLISAHSFAAMGANHISQIEVGVMSGLIGAGNTLILGGDFPFCDFRYLAIHAGNQIISIQPE
ncbi:MAG: hypothetical protein FI725_06205 [SAR202 cluster bacterium]|nr:hypothetical protein [SAR202 cluster bacterium]|tara:strand:- start:1111 stop:1323 length:213 start_codon:yes stop_codon:yes gene_type:complete